MIVVGQAMILTGTLDVGVCRCVRLLIMTRAQCRFWVWQELNVGLIVDERVCLDLVILSMSEDIHGCGEVGE